MNILPKGAFTIIKDAPIKQTKAGIFLGDTEAMNKIDTGTISLTSPELSEFQGSKVRFREQFGEPLEIDGIEHVYFRDYDSAIFYRID